MNTSLRLLVSVDMEGAIGITHVDQIVPGEPEWERARVWLTREVNSAIEAIHSAAVAEDLPSESILITVVDAHWSMDNILPDQLDRRVAALVRGMERELPQLAILDRSYDAVLAVGVHDQTPSNNSARAGLLAHTWLPGWRWSVNGEEVSEALLNAYTMGEMGIPLIFASGDDVIADGLMSFYSKRDLPITTVTVKKALGLQSAAIPALEASYADVASGVASAVRRFVRARPGPLLPPSPVDLRIWPGDCDRGRIASIPNQETSGEGWIRVRAQSFAAAIRTGAEILNTFYPDALRVMEEQARQLKYSYLQRRVLGGAP